MANSVLAKLAVLISANTAEFNRTLKTTSSQLSKFQSNVTDSLKGLAAGFGAVKIADFVLDVSRLAGEAQGVREAFERLPNSIKLMNELKQSTAGTVSELELMRKSVMASNFGISLEALPRLLEFASVRAKQTGQSIDYLVDSIVTGIGRKSKLILDNLGISAVDLTEALGGASTAASSIGDVADAVGKIAERELTKMGGISENASTKLERLAASWINLKVAIGDAANGTGFLATAIDQLTVSVDIAASKNVDFWEKLAFFTGNSGVKASIVINDLAEAAKKAAHEQIKHAKAISVVDSAMKSANPDDYIKAFKDNLYYTEILNEYNSRLVKTEKEKGTQLENIANLTEKLNLLNADQLTLTGDQLIATNKEIKATEDKIKKLKELGVETGKQINLERTLALNRLKNLEITGPTVAGFDTSKLSFEKPDDKSIQAMANAQDALAAATARATEQQQIQNDLVREQQTVFANAAISIGDAIGSAISANESLAQVMIKTTQVIIDQIQKQVIANIVAGSSKLFAANPILGIGVVALAGGIIKGLLGKIGGGGGGYSAVNSVRPSYSRASVGMVQSTVVVQGVIRGQDIYLSNQNYQKNSGYTKG